MGKHVHDFWRLTSVRFFGRWMVAVLLLFPLCSVSKAGSPWFEPGGLLARHNLQLIADAGAIDGPINTWPISTPALYRQLSSFEGQGTAASLGSALGLTGYLLDGYRKKGIFLREVSGGAAFEPMAHRGFQYQQRANGQTALALDWMSGSFAARLRGLWDIPSDQKVRPDGSYVASFVGDWIFTAGYVDRFWGPGWSTSLAWSMQSAPPLSVWLQRRFHRAARLPLFKWLGPWSLVALVSQTDATDHTFESSIAGARFSFRPLSGLSLGLSFLHRVCWTDCPDANTGADAAADEALRQSEYDSPAVPGRQLVADGRVRPFKVFPMAAYAQGSATAAQGGGFDTLAWMVGLEVWSTFSLSWLSSVRLYGEYIDGRLNPLSGNRQAAVTWTDFSDYKDGKVLLEGADARTIAVGTFLMFGKRHVVHLQTKHVQRHRRVERLLEVENSESDRDVLDVRYEYRWARHVLSLGGGVVRDTALNSAQHESAGPRFSVRLARIY